MLGVLSETNGQLFHAVQFSSCISFAAKLTFLFFATLGCSKSSVGVHRTQGLRVVDFFRQLDKNNSKKVSKAEFISGVKKMGIPMTRKQLKKLIRILDTDNDGMIEYREMVAIKKDEVFDFYHKKKTFKKDDPLLQSFKEAQKK